MSFLLIPGKVKPEHWIRAIHAIAPDIQVEVWPEVKDPEAVEFAAVWRYPQGELQKYPNLRCISSIGAGVEQILSDPYRPPVPVVRVVDELLSRDMTQYVVWAVLDHVRKMAVYRRQQQQHQWKPYGAPTECQVGILGLGELGKTAGQALQELGFLVSGWSRHQKEIPGIASYYGNDQLAPFLKQIAVLVCMLPLTPATSGILNANLFKQLPPGAYLINVARGGHLIETDLLAAIDSGQLSGACLDVFNTEPLPENSPLWSHPKITITPHIASVTNPTSAAKQLVANYRRALAGEPLLNLVNLDLGY